MEDDKLAYHSTSLAAASNGHHSHSATGGPTTLLINGTSNGQQVNGVANGVSSYENALKKLVHILKLKANDNLKQLEDLWDSINAPPPSHSTQTAAAANRPNSSSKSGSSLSPRTTPSPPLFNSSSCSNSSTISESSSSPSPTSSSSSSSPPHVSSSNKPKQPQSTANKPEPTATLKRDASKLSTSEGQEPKKTKLATTGNNNTTKKVPTASSAAAAAKPAAASGAKASTVNAAKKDDKTAKPSTAAPKPAAKAPSKTVKELTKSSLKREFDTSTDVQPPQQPPERPSPFGNVALVSVKEEELNKLEEGKSIEITFDTPAMIEASSTSTGSVFTSPGLANSSDESMTSNAKRFKLDIDQPSNGDFGGTTTTTSTVDMSETADLDDMLTGLTCHVCKKFNQENNNKLIECSNCKNMFHQLCHRPPLAPDELEEQCSECISPASSSNNNNNTAAAESTPLSRDGSLDEPQDDHSKESSASTVNIGSSTSLLNSPGSGNNVKQTQGQQLFAMKGLAALATKFNPTQAPSSAPIVSSKNNDLFNKFKQSASSTSLAAAATPPVSSPIESSSNNLLAKNKNPFIQTAQPVSSLSASQQQLQQQQKRNIFNIAASTPSAAIPVKVNATPTGDKRAK